MMKNKIVKILGSLVVGGLLMAKATNLIGVAKVVQPCEDSCNSYYCKDTSNNKKCIIGIKKVKKNEKFFYIRKGFKNIHVIKIF